MKRLIRNLKNWRWWVVLPFATVLLAIAVVISIIVITLELLTSVVEIFNFGKRHNSFFKHVLEWVQEDY